MFSHTKSRVIAGILAAGVTIALAGCATGDPLENAPAEEPEAGSIIVGSQGFAESDILAQIYGQVLAANGYDVSYNPGIGSRETFIPGLQDGSINLIPDYSGNLLYGADPEATATSSEDVEAALPAALEELELRVLDAAPAEDADALVVTKEFAAENNLVTIADLAPIAKDITIGANTEFQGRPYGEAGLKSVYGVEGYTFKAIDDYGGPGTLKDLLDNNIQVADIYTTTPSIKQNDLVVLEDPENLIAAQNIIPLLSEDAYSDEIADLLNPISAKITTDELLALNEKSSSDAKPSPEAVAKEWLEANGLLN